MSPAECDRLYNKMLDRLNPHMIASQLIDLARGDIPVIVCYEATGKGLWCHRAVTAQWLAEALGRPIPELGFEALPQSDHPLMPPKLRRQ